MTQTSDELLAALCRERYGSLTALGIMLTGSRHGAEDLLHDALIAVFSRPRKLTSLNAADAYVRRAMTTRFIDGKRSKSSRDRVAREYAARQPAVHIDDPSDWGPLNDLLATLAPRVRACIVLRFLEDMSVADTALALSLSEGAVKRYVADGLHVLNRALGTDDTGTDEQLAHVQQREAKP